MTPSPALHPLFQAFLDGDRGRLLAIWSLRPSLTELTATPQLLPLDYFLRLIDARGWHYELDAPEIDEALQATPWYRARLVALSAHDAGRDALLDALCQCMPSLDARDLPHLSRWVLGFQPPHRRQAWAERLSKSWVDAPPRHAAWGYCALREMGVDLGKTDWPQWWAQSLSHPGQEKVWLEVLRLVAARDRVRPPEGLVWTPKVAHAWGLWLGNLLLPATQQAQTGYRPTHEFAHAAVFELSELMAGWNLETRQTRQAFYRGLAEARPDYAQMLASPTTNLAASPRFMASLDRWQARQAQERLEDGLPPAAPHPSPALRL